MANQKYDGLSARELLGRQTFSSLYPLDNSSDLRPTLNRGSLLIGFFRLNRFTGFLKEFVTCHLNEL